MKNDFKQYLMHHGNSLESEVVPNNSNYDLFFIFPFVVQIKTSSYFVEQK